jgi:hypothetical protein
VIVQLNDTWLAVKTGRHRTRLNYGDSALKPPTIAGPASFTYDANGALTPDGTSNCDYVAENRLVCASAGGGAQLSYDPLAH